MLPQDLIEHLYEKDSLTLTYSDGDIECSVNISHSRQSFDELRKIKHNIIAKITWYYQSCGVIYNDKMLELITLKPRHSAFHFYPSYIILLANGQSIVYHNDSVNDLPIRYDYTPIRYDDIISITAQIDLTECLLVFMGG